MYSKSVIFNYKLSYLNLNKKCSSPQQLFEARALIFSYFTDEETERLK